MSTESLEYQDLHGLQESLQVIKEKDEIIEKFVSRIADQESRISDLVHKIEQHQWEQRQQQYSQQSYQKVPLSELIEQGFAQPYSFDRQTNIDLDTAVDTEKPQMNGTSYNRQQTPNSNPEYLVSLRLTSNASQIILSSHMTLIKVEADDSSENAKTKQMSNLKEIQSIERIFKEALEEIQVLKQKIQEQNLTKNNEKSQIQEKNSQIAELQKVLQQQNGSVIELNQKIEQHLEAEAKLKKENNRLSEELIKKVKYIEQEHQQEIKQKDQHIEEMQSKLKKIEKQIEDLKEERTHDVVEMTEQKNKLKTLREKLEEKEAERKQETTQLKKSLQTLEEEKKVLQNECQQRVKQMGNQLERKQKELAEEYKSQKSEVVSVNSQTDLPQTQNQSAANAANSLTQKPENNRSNVVPKNKEEPKKQSAVENSSNQKQPTTQDPQNEKGESASEREKSSLIGSETVQNSDKEQRTVERDRGNQKSEEAELSNSKDQGPSQPPTEMSKKLLDLRLPHEKSSQNSSSLNSPSSVHSLPQKLSSTTPPIVSAECSQSAINKLTRHVSFSSDRIILEDPMEYCEQDHRNSNGQSLNAPESIQTSQSLDQSNSRMTFSNNSDRRSSNSGEKPRRSSLKSHSPEPINMDTVKMTKNTSIKNTAEPDESNKNKSVEKKAEKQRVQPLQRGGVSIFKNSGSEGQDHDRDEEQHTATFKRMIDQSDKLVEGSHDENLGLNIQMTQTQSQILENSCERDETQGSDSKILSKQSLQSSQLAENAKQQSKEHHEHIHSDPLAADTSNLAAELLEFKNSPQRIMEEILTETGVLHNGDNKNLLMPENPNYRTNPFELSLSSFGTVHGKHRGINTNTLHGSPSKSENVDSFLHDFIREQNLPKNQSDQSLTGMAGNVKPSLQPDLKKTQSNNLIDLKVIEREDDHGPTPETPIKELKQEHHYSEEQEPPTRPVNVKINGESSKQTHGQQASKEQRPEQQAPESKSHLNEAQSKPDTLDFEALLSSKEKRANEKFSSGSKLDGGSSRKKKQKVIYIRH